jgi:hypothetical protein
MAKGVMSADLLRRVMEKAVAECDVESVALFNWTEPLLHREIAELVRIVQGFDVPCDLSSNLNVLRDPDTMLAANPRFLRVSVSGFHQAAYGLTHRGGDIERVKRNMAALAEAHRRTGSTTRVQVLYHRYLGNLDDEVHMRRFAGELGFQFDPAWAFMMPLEKVLAHLEGHQDELTDDDRQTIGRLALPLEAASAAAQTYKERPCTLLNDQVTMDFQANVMLCCAVYDPSRYAIGNYLETPIKEIQRGRNAHPQCGPCMDRGLHVYVSYGAPAEFDAIARERVQRYYAEAGAFLSGAPLRRPNPLKAAIKKVLPISLERTLRRLRSPR